MALRARRREFLLFHRLEIPPGHSRTRRANEHVLMNAIDCEREAEIATGVHPQTHPLRALHKIDGVWRALTEDEAALISTLERLGEERMTWCEISQALALGEV